MSKEGKLALVVGAASVLLEITATENYLETSQHSQSIERQCAALSRIPGRGQCEKISTIC